LNLFRDIKNILIQQNNCEDSGLHAKLRNFI
jgi:hypothetical protein